MTTTNASLLLSHPEVLAEISVAERLEGWLARCQDNGRYVALTQSFVEALSAELKTFASHGSSVLEICAGDGSLAAALRAAGVAVTSTDANAIVGSDCVRLTAAEALSAYAPGIVLGAFVPIDSGVDALVLKHPTVHTYVVINARIGGELGTSSLWSTPGWTRRQMVTASERLLTRHDIWFADNRPVRQVGEVWCFTRNNHPLTAAAAAHHERSA